MLESIEAPEVDAASRVVTTQLELDEERMSRLCMRFYGSDQIQEWLKEAGAQGMSNNQALSMMVVGIQIGWMLSQSRTTALLRRVEDFLRRGNKNSRLAKDVTQFISLVRDEWSAKIPEGKPPSGGERTSYLGNGDNHAEGNRASAAPPAGAGTAEQNQPA